MVTPNREITPEKRDVIVNAYYEDCIQATTRAVNTVLCPCKGCQVVFAAETAIATVCAAVVSEVRDGKPELMEEVRKFVKQLQEKYPLGPVPEPKGNKPT